MNSVCIAGRLTRNIELRTTSTGRSVIDTNVAVRRTENETDFVDIEIWGTLADVVAKYCGKGQFITVQGKLRVSSFTDKEGKKRIKTYVLADSIDFAGAGQGTERKDTEENDIFAEELADVMATDDELPF